MESLERNGCITVNKSDMGGAKRRPCSTVSQERKMWMSNYPSLNSNVVVWDGEHDGEHGVIVGTSYDGEDDLFEIELESIEDNCVILSFDEFEVI